MEVIMDEDRKNVEVSFSAKGPRKCPYCQKEVEKDLEEGSEIANDIKV